MAHHKPLEAQHRATSPLAGRRTPRQRIGLVDARRRSRHPAGRLRLHQDTPTRLARPTTPRGTRHGCRVTPDGRGGRASVPESPPRPKGAPVNPPHRALAPASAASLSASSSHTTTATSPIASTPASAAQTRRLLSRARKASRAWVFLPRSDASTISVFCCAVNFRYFLVSLNSMLLWLERPIFNSAPDGAQPASRANTDQFRTEDVSTRSQGPRHGVCPGARVGTSSAQARRWAAQAF
jgi:hypothetical protein